AVQGESAAGRFLRGAFLGLLVALTALLAVWIAVLPAILSVVGHGLPPEQRALVATNVLRLIPYYYLNGINLLSYGVLQSRRAFMRSALIPIATPLVIMALLATHSADLNVLIGALTLGTGVETLLVFRLIKKHQRGSRDGQSQASSSLREFAW